jgi:IS605 OrfB family transposase
MGQAIRTTKLPLDLGDRKARGANTAKRAYLQTTGKILDAARAFYVAFFLAHQAKLSERVPYFSEQHQDMRERLLSANELLTWAEFQTVATKEHPHPLPEWNFSARFPDFPFVYRRSVIKDAIGKVRSYRSNLANWPKTVKKKGKPGIPGASNHATLYEGAWEQQSPKLVLRGKAAEIHFSQTKEIKAKKVIESKRDADLVTVAVDLNVKNLAVITVRQQGVIRESIFCKDNGLDQHRYRHLKHISKKQWQSGKPVKGERSNRHLWRHIRRQNADAAHKTARAIARVCAKYPGCVLVFERLRRIKPKGGSKSRRLNRKQANQLRGQINQLAREKAFAESVVTVEVNPWGTSQYCSRCGAKGERFSVRAGQRVKERGGKLFRCVACGYEAHADHNASTNLHHSFYSELSWQKKPKPPANRRGKRGHSP